MSLLHFLSDCQQGEWERMKVSFYSMIYSMTADDSQMLDMPRVETPALAAIELVVSLAALERRWTDHR